MSNAARESARERPVGPGPAATTSEAQAVRIDQASEARLAGAYDALRKQAEKAIGQHVRVLWDEVRDQTVARIAKEMSKKYRQPVDELVSVLNRKLDTLPKRKGRPAKKELPWILLGDTPL